MKQLPPQGALTIGYGGRATALHGEVRLNEPATSIEADFRAIWDTGATNTVITQNVVDTLRLKPIGMVDVHTPQGSHNTPAFLVGMIFPDSKLMFNGVRVSLGKLNGFDVLIGMDIIGFGDFSVTNKGGQTTMSFRVPSMKTIDFVKELNLQKVSRWITPNKKRRK